MQPDTPRFDKQQARQGSLRFGIGLLVIEAWVFALVAFATLPRAHGFWLFFLPYALLIPPLGVVRQYFPGWRSLAVSTLAWMSAAFIGVWLRPAMSDWLLHTVIGQR